MPSGLLVIGSLNTDITVRCTQFPDNGELALCDSIGIGPGGKSRNIAAMAAEILGPNKVAMISKTVRDRYGLWHPPLESLLEAGVDVSNVQIDNPDGTELPGIAFIPVDKQGANKIYLCTSKSGLSHSDINNASELFGKYAVLALTLEMPADTALYSLKKAHDADMYTVLDPGGIQPGQDISQMLRYTCLVKPNEHEALLMTGVAVKDYESAKEAAYKLRRQGAQDILITAGAKGAYLFSKDIERHISPPNLKSSNKPDETGCGDQVAAVMCAYLSDGSSILDAAKTSIRAGTLQYHRQGIVPVTKEELRVLGGVHASRMHLSE